MILEFTKNIHFTRLIKAAGRLREFNFRKLPDHLFHVDVSDERGNRIMFTMQRAENNDWKIVEDAPLPQWVSGTEKELNDYILAAIN
ncbi:hypothetical protein V9K67_23440 [Paraflavisolibacter sp. H34]|uniref:hypothetical protein n=1 Tax=Huijunlia imazamoxiresistens TaxID=3127457 RepID=UPI00301A9062